MDIARPKLYVISTQQSLIRKRTGSDVLRKTFAKSMDKQTLIQLLQ